MSAPIWAGIVPPGDLGGTRAVSGTNHAQKASEA
jgi:hypothetical protein